MSWPRPGEQKTAEALMRKYERSEPPSARPMPAPYKRMTDKQLLEEGHAATNPLVRELTERWSEALGALREAKREVRRAKT